MAFCDSTLSLACVSPTDVAQRCCRFACLKHHSSSQKGSKESKDTLLKTKATAFISPGYQCLAELLLKSCQLCQMPLEGSTPSVSIFPARIKFLHQRSPSSVGMGDACLGELLPSLLIPARGTLTPCTFPESSRKCPITGFKTHRNPS